MRRRAVAAICDRRFLLRRGGLPYTPAVARVYDPRSICWRTDHPDKQHRDETSPVIPMTSIGTSRPALQATGATAERVVVHFPGCVATGYEED